MYFFFIEAKNIIMYEETFPSFLVPGFLRGVVSLTYNIQNHYLSQPVTWQLVSLPFSGWLMLSLSACSTYRSVRLSQARTPAPLPPPPEEPGCEGPGGGACWGGGGGGSGGSAGGGGGGVGRIVCTTVSSGR